MRVTAQMIQAARRAEYDHFNKGRTAADGRFIPTPDAIIRAMLEAALATVEPDKAPTPRIVTATKPRRR
jgi:hypothetical protein